MVISYAADFPGELLPGVKALVERHKHLLPIWVYQLEIEYDARSDSFASINVEEPYRRAFLDIGASWVDADQERVLLHEFAHLYNVPLLAEARQILEFIYPGDDVAKDIANSSLTNAVERSTEDLVELILKLREGECSQQFIRRTKATTTPTTKKKSKGLPTPASSAI